MQTVAMRKLVVLLLAALIMAATAFSVAAAVTASALSDEQAGSRVGTSPGSREST